VTPVRLTDHVYLLPLGQFQAYAYVDGDEITLVDTGATGTEQQLDDELAALGLGRTASLRQIVLTHHHDDHTGNCRRLRERTGCSVHAHAADAPVIAGEQSGTPPSFSDWERELHRQVAGDLPAAAACPVDVAHDDGAVLGFLGHAVVYSTPSHTAGSIALHLPDEGLLLTGDVLASQDGQPMPGVFNVHPEDVRADLARLGRLEFDTAAVGHGSPITGNAAGKLRALLSS
jgi:glyoxylase-like metal-dependent hydrolase (beta-lactamase superfamily II)